MGEARVVEGQAARGVLPAGVEREALDRLAVGQALEALEDHHDRHDERRHRAPPDVGEQIGEQRVGEEREALPVEQGMDRVGPDPAGRRTRPCPGRRLPGGAWIPSDMGGSCDPGGHPFDLRALPGEL